MGQRASLYKTAAPGTSARVASGERKELVLPGRRARLWHVHRAGRFNGSRAVQPVTSHRPASLSVGAGVQAIMTDLVESVRQDVLDEAPEKLDRREGHGLGAARAEGHGGGRDSEQTAIGDRHAVSVTAEILEHVLGTAKRLLGIDDPLAHGDRGKKAVE